MGKAMLPSFFGNWGTAIADVVLEASGPMPRLETRL